MRKRLSAILVLLITMVPFSNLPAQIVSSNGTEDLKAIDIRKYVTAEDLFGFVETLSSEKYAGRLTGHPGFDQSAVWVIDLLESWGIQGLGDEGTFLQKFPHPYTDVKEGCELLMHLNNSGGGEVRNYEYVEEYIPGSTSGNGSKTAEVVYVGYGITAPELGYDDYADVDVRGKIVLYDKEVPVNTSHEDFLKWRPYSFHQYKLHNAVKHGAVGMLYNYHIANPNNDYSEHFVYSHVGKVVVAEIFKNTGKEHQDLIRNIAKNLKPESFNTGKRFTINNITEHHANGVGANVIGFIEGIDPILKDEYILIGGHLDHLGKCYTTMPGANDNASAVAVTMGVAKALARSGLKLKRSVVFILFGAEEAAIEGSQLFLKHPTMGSLNKIVAYLNMDGVGIGSRVSVQFAGNYPTFYSFLEKNNQKYGITQLSGGTSTNLGRPRLDAAFFDWYGLPVLSIATGGSAEDFANYRYHTPYDNINNINGKIMLDLSELLLLSIVEMGNTDELLFKRGMPKKEFID